MRTKYFYKTLISSLLILICFSFINTSRSAMRLSKKLAGHILLQVEANGEAWYLDPRDEKRYFLGKPDDAFSLMRELGVGISDIDLAKIPIGIITPNQGIDQDQDGLTDVLEEILGTDSTKSDTDGDGYNDLEEIINNYNPLGSGSLTRDLEFTEKQLGKIFLQVECHGEAWYLNPRDKKRYFLGRPIDAFEVMRKLGLGISNQDISEINAVETPCQGVSTRCQDVFEDNVDNNSSSSQEPESENDDENMEDFKEAEPLDIENLSGEKVFENAARAIAAGDLENAKKYFSPKAQNSIEYVMGFLDQEGKATLAQIMLGSKLLKSNDILKIYSTQVYFGLGGYDVPVNFLVQKYDGKWKVSNL